jgi:hypothetical protein
MAAADLDSRVRKLAAVVRKREGRGKRERELVLCDVLCNFKLIHDLFCLSFFFFVKLNN